MALAYVRCWYINTAMSMAMERLKSPKWWIKKLKMGGSEKASAFLCALQENVFLMYNIEFIEIDWAINWTNCYNEK